jgi:hypothetical protein
LLGRLEVDGVSGTGCGMFHKTVEIAIRAEQPQHLAPQEFVVGTRGLDVPHLRFGKRFFDRSVLGRGS